LLTLLAESSSNGDTSLLTLFILLVPLLVFAVGGIFLFRWQVRLMDDLRESMHRIADAVEEIAQKR
jgi:hypothetical protein